MFAKKRWTSLAIALIGVIALGQGAEAANWWETISVKGNFRYRHEMIKKGDSDARNRQRIRARLGIFGQVNDNTKVGIQLATGSDDPVSTNQTLDNSFSTKQIGIDLAYFETKHDALPGFTLTAGKFKNPFFKPGKSELIWDGDLNPEGGALKFRKGNEDFDITLVGSGLWIEERSSDPNSFIMAGQGMARLFMNEKKSSIALGGALFSYTNAEGFQPFYNADKSMGNSVVDHVINAGTSDEDTVDVYANDFELIELFAEVTHKFASTPVTIMADYVQNTSADSLETGWLLGLRVGKTKKPGSWAFHYNYRQVEKDAVLGAFTDSDFSGGGTDAKGHEFGG